MAFARLSIIPHEFPNQEGQLREVQMNLPPGFDLRQAKCEFLVRGPFRVDSRDPKFDNLWFGEYFLASVPLGVLRFSFPPSKQSKVFSVTGALFPSCWQF